MYRMWMYRIFTPLVTQSLSLSQTRGTLRHMFCPSSTHTQTVTENCPHVVSDKWVYRDEAPTLISGELPIVPDLDLYIDACDECLSSILCPSSLLPSEQPG